MVQSIIDGQKAGESSARQPEIAPDSARSVTKLKQVIGLTEGEIKGFSKDDIKLDGTPLSALSSEIICDYRFGTVGQEYIPGVEEVANEIGVGVELRGDLDWVKLITNTDIDHIGIRLRWGPLQTSHTNGDVTGVYIIYTVSIAPVNGSYEKVLDATISDKTSDSYERYHEFKLPPSEDGWMIKVSRLTPSAQSSLVSDKMYVQAYAEIIKSKFTFPYTALIYLEYDARSFANVAKVAVNAKGMIIKVPSNYDPETRQYTGLWNGSFKMAYSNNPAWVYFDIVTQPRYGCGDRIDQSMVDKWSLYRLGQYCDQMVDDGYGGLEPRFTCNVYLQSKERAYDVLNRLTGLFRAFNFWNGSQLIVDADIPQDTSYLYTNANVVDGLFEYAGTAATDLYSAAKVAWDNPANGFNTEYEAVSYEHLIKKLGFKTLELDAWGCTSRGQALRAGRWALLAESDTVTFKVGMDGYLAMPGKIIEIQDEFYAGKSNGGRVISISSSGLEITLDRPVETIAGDTISFNTLAGTVKKYNIASSNGSVVTLTESVGSTIERMHIWAINSSQLATQKYRILTVKYDGIGEFTISAVEYNPNKYEDIDSNITFDEPPTSIINPIAQVAVKNVIISSNEYVYQGLNTVNLEIKWERAENAVEYLVELKKDDTTWLKLPPTGNNSIVLENVYAGYYIAKVTAVSAYELKSLPAYSVKTNVLGKQSMPLPPLNPRVLPIQFGVEFYWDFPQGATDTAVSRIVVAYLDPTGAVDDSGFLTYDKAYSDNKIVIQNLDLHTRVWFKVKLVDKLGFESPYTNWVSGVPSQDIDKIMDIISGQIEQSDLYDDLSQKIEVGFEASAAAVNAQTAANQAQASADQAQAAADQAQAQVTATTTELRGLLNTTADGLTQEILDRQEGDADVVGQLTTYKTSNDAAMSAVQQQVEAATSASSANATALTNLNTEVVAAHNLASNALQQAQSATDATSTNASNLIALNSRMATAEQDINGVKTSKLDASVIQQYRTAVDQDSVTAGELTQFKSTLKVGGVNVLRNSKEPRSGVNEYLMYENSVELKDFYDQNLNKDVTISCEILVPVAGNVQIYTSNSSAHNFSFGTPIPANQWTRVVATVKPIPHDTNPDWHTSSLEFYGEYGTGRIVTVRNVQLEAGNVATSWSPSPRDIQGAIDANAQAIRNTETKVATIDGTVTAQAADILNLNTGLTNLSNSKLDASIIQQYRTAVDQDSVTSGALMQFKSALKIGGDNLFTGTKTFNNQATENSTSSFYPSYAGFGGNTQEFLPNALFGTHTVVKSSSSWCGFYLREADGISWEAQEDMVVSFWANASADVHVYGIASQLGHAATIPANQPMTKYEVLIPKGKPLRNSSNQGIIEFYFPNGGELWYGAVMLQVGTKSTSWQPSSKDNEMDTSQFASATALENLTTNVSNIDGVVSSHTNQINAHQASINTALDIITIRDTRYDNFPPSHYRQNYALKEVREFKVSGTISLPTWYPAYCTLVTRTQWTDASGGNVIQRVEFDDPTLNLYRKSIDSGENWDTWSAWENKLVGSLSAKADATRVEEINNKVTQTENSIAALSETTTQHTATLGEISKSTLSKLHVLDLSALDPNMYYPVGMYVTMRGTSHILLTRSLGDFLETALPVWATHGAGFTAKCEWTTNGSGWGANNIERTILGVDSIFTLNNQPSFGYINQIGTASLEFIMVRGGAKYYLQTSSLVSDPIIHTQPTNYNGAVIKPAPWQGNMLEGWDTSDWSVTPALNTKASATALEQTKAEVQEINGQVSSLASQTNTLSTTVGNNTAAIQLQQSSIDGINAKATLQVEAGGTIGGVVLGNNQGVVDFLIRSNTFAITTPIGVPNDTKYMMTYQANDQTLPNGTVIPKGLKVNDAIIGTINANKIYAESLSAISANLGTIKVGSANIDDGAITSAKIGDAQVKTLKIDGEAVTAISNVVYPTYTCASTYTINSQLTAAILAMKPDYPSTVKGLLIGSPFASVTVNPEGGGVQVDISTNAMWQSRVNGGSGGTLIYYIAVFLNGVLKVAQIDFTGNTSIPGQDNPYSATANSFVRFIFKDIPNGALMEAYYAVAFAQTPSLYVMKARDLTITVTSVKR